MVSDPLLCFVSLDKAESGRVLTLELCLSPGGEGFLLRITVRIRFDVLCRRTLPPALLVSVWNWVEVSSTGLRHKAHAHQNSWGCLFLGLGFPDVFFLPCLSLPGR